MLTISIIGANPLSVELAALFAGCGTRVLFFSNKGEARKSLSNLVRHRSNLFFDLKDASLIEPVDFDDHKSRMGECDWIIENTQGSIDAKHKLFNNVLSCIRDDAIVTSCAANSTLGGLVKSMDENLRRRFFVTHFFYPPRYVKLVEIVSDEKVDEMCIDKISRYLRDTAGKGVVFAKDSPNFIADRIGVMYVMNAMHLIYEQGWPIEAVDKVMGFATGRPASGIFRMADAIGVDVIAGAATSAAARLLDDPFASRFRIPQYIQGMIVNGWTGNASGQGFYKSDGVKRYAIDPASLNYRPQLAFMPRSIAENEGERDVASRLKRIVMSDDPGGEIAWSVISHAIVYAAEVSNEVAHDFTHIDAAMRWGYGWKLGPFETWDAIGIENVCARLEDEKRKIPAVVRSMLKGGKKSFYENRSENPPAFRVMNPSGELFSNKMGHVSDLGEDVLGLGFHENCQTIESNWFELFAEVAKRLEREFSALIVFNHGDVFPSPVDFYDVLMKAKLKRWKDLGVIIDSHQAMIKWIRCFKKPVVFAPSGVISGVALEYSLASDLSCAWVNSSYSFNHVRLGLIPAAGGCVNLLKLCEARERRLRADWSREKEMCDDGGPHPIAKRAFETIVGAVKSGSAIDAVHMCMRAHGAHVTMDREKLIDDAKRLALESTKNFIPKYQDFVILQGDSGKLKLVSDIDGYVRLRHLSAEDAKICEKLAHVISGGDRPTIHKTSEAHVMELEREAWLELIGTPSTQKRIDHYLKTGRYLKDR